MSLSGSIRHASWSWIFFISIDLSLDIDWGFRYAIFLESANGGRSLESVRGMFSFVCLFHGTLKNKTNKTVHKLVIPFSLDLFHYLLIAFLKYYPKDCHF